MNKQPASCIHNNAGGATMCDYNTRPDATAKGAAAWVFVIGGNLGRALDSSFPLAFMGLTGENLRLPVFVFCGNRLVPCDRLLWRSHC